MAGDAPVSLVATDLNGDGRLDVAASNIASNDISVLLGNGNGTFRPQRRFPAGVSPSSLVTGDMNGDGVLDLAAIESNVVSVLLGGGDGTFVKRGSFAAGALPQGLAAADFNRDGRIDLATANFGSSDVSVLLGRGDGSFRKQRLFPAGMQLWALAAADLNGDGRPDIASTSGVFFSELTILLNDFTVDVTRPLLSCPGPMIVQCTGPEGTPVSFEAAATDDCDENPFVACEPPPGSTLPVGTTFVTCTATDSSGNRSECTFEVQVTCGGQAPGDCNQDGAVDISDGICLLNFLFSDRTVVLPCDGAGDLDLLNWNGDAFLDLTDAVALINWLFLSEAGHVLGKGCRHVEGCPQLCPVGP
jgi:hypothetical protein